MKALFVLLLVTLIALTPAFSVATDEVEEEVKYTITIEVTYNAVVAAEANKIVSEILDTYKTACKSKVVVKKAGNDAYLISGTSASNWVDVTLTR